MTLCGVGGYKNIQSEAPEMILARQVTKKNKFNAFHAHHGLFHYTITMLLEIGASLFCCTMLDLMLSWSSWKCKELCMELRAQCL